MTAMTEELLYDRRGVRVRRVILEPGESSPWHTDSCDRMTVIVSGDRLAIEFRHSGEIREFDVRAGQVDWDEPGRHVHRAVNVGDVPYEEIAVFFLGDPDDVPQPDVSE